MGKAAKQQDNVTLVFEWYLSVLSAVPKSTVKIQKEKELTSKQIISEVCVCIYVIICEHVYAHQHIWFCIQLISMEAE